LCSSAILAVSVEVRQQRVLALAVRDRLPKRVGKGLKLV
jgi:hypothetical protein